MRPRRPQKAARSDTESDVVEAFWCERNDGELIHEFRVPTMHGDPSRDRELDGSQPGSGSSPEP